MTSVRVMTVGEVAQLLRCHPSTIYRLLKRREIPAFRVGTDWRFNLEEIDRWRFAQQQPVGKSPPPRRR
jgi:excisionase family DNA binding protein